MKNLTKIFSLFTFFALSSYNSYSFTPSCEIPALEQAFLLEKVEEDRPAFITSLEDCKKANRQFFSQIIEINPDYFRFADESLKNDQFFVSQIALANLEIFKHTAKKLKSDPFFMEKIVRSHPEAMKYADDKLKDGKSFMKKMIAINPKHFVFASQKLHNNKKLALMAINKDGMMLEFASKRLQNDKEVVVAALKANNLAIEFVSEDLMQDEEIQQLAESNVDFLEDFDTILKENYAGLAVGVNGARGYKIINLAKNFDNSQLIYRPFTTKWQQIIEDYRETAQVEFITKKKIKKSWKDDLVNYPELVKQIEEIFLKQKIDQNTIDNLQIISLWQVQKEPETLAINLYLIRGAKSQYLKDQIANVNSLTLIARNVSNLEEEEQEEDMVKEDSAAKTNTNQKSTAIGEIAEEITEAISNIIPLAKEKEEVKNEEKNQEHKEVEESTIEAKENPPTNQWKITVINANFDANLKMDLAFKNGHKRYEIWDLFKVNAEDENPKIILRIEDKNSEYFEVYSKQINNGYALIYQGGGNYMPINLFENFKILPR